MEINGVDEFNVLKVFYDVTKVLGLKLDATDELFTITVADERDKAQACGNLARLYERLGTDRKIYIEKYETLINNAKKKY